MKLTLKSAHKVLFTQTRRVVYFNVLVLANKTEKKDLARVYTKHFSVIFLSTVGFAH